MTDWMQKEMKSENTCEEFFSCNNKEIMATNGVWDHRVPCVKILVNTKQYLINYFNIY